MQVPLRVPAVVLAATMLATPALADAKKKKRTPPSKAVVTKLLSAAYCAPEEAMNGSIVSTVEVRMKKPNIAKPRVGKSWLDGTPANRRTWVFPVRASYFCDYTATAAANPGWEPDDKRIKSDYIFFRDELGSWTHRYKGQTEKTIERWDAPPDHDRDRGAGG